MKKILLITHCYPQNTSDMRGSFLVPIVKYLRDFDIETVVVTPSWSKTKSKIQSRVGWLGEEIVEFSWGGVRFEALSIWNPVHILSLGVFLMRWAGAVRYASKRYGELDATVCAWGVPAGILRLLRLIPTRQCAVWWLGSDFNKFNRPFTRWLIRMVARSSSVNWANSKVMCEQLRKLVSAEVQFVPLANSKWAKYDPQGVIENKAKLRLLTIGRLERVKGIDLGIQAVQACSEMKEMFEYRIVGEGSQRAELESLIGSSDNIRLLGYLDDDAVSAELCSADFVVLPSRSEGMPLVFFEALSAGKKVIASDVGDIRMCLAGKDIGWVSAPGDVGALAKSIRTALASNTAFDEQHARQVLDCYAPKAAMVSFEELVDWRVR